MPEILESYLYWFVSTIRMFIFVTWYNEETSIWMTYYKQITAIISIQQEIYNFMSNSIWIGINSLIANHINFSITWIIPSV